MLDDTGNVPAASMLRAFQLIRPLGDLVTDVTLIDRLNDREATQAIWALKQWASGHIPFPGGTFVEMIRTLAATTARPVKSRSAAPSASWPTSPHRF